MAPFKLNPRPADPGFDRMPTGRFAARVNPIAPPQVVRRSSDEGTDIRGLIADARQPDHERPKSAPVTASEIPWGPAGPYNDANRPPFKLKP